MPIARVSGQERRRILSAAKLSFSAPPILLGDLEYGQPELVNSIEGEPAYWLVPGLRENRIRAIARVFRDGKIGAVAELRQSATSAAAAATGLTRAEAMNVRDELSAAHPRAVISDPMLVFDGAIFREVWLLTLREGRKAPIGIFANSAGRYTRRMKH